MKFYCLCLAAMLAGSNVVLGQESAAKVVTQQSFDYNRSSLSFVYVNSENSSYVEALKSCFVNLDNKTAFDGKFDYNVIKTNSINVSGDKIGRSEILEALNSESVGRQILDYWVQYDGNSFNPSLMEYRAKYNATDQDVIIDNAAKVSHLFTQGMGLMGNSYVMVVGPIKIEEKVDKKGNVTYTAKGVSYVYKAGIDNSILTSVIDGWISEDMSSAEKSQKKSAYESLSPELTCEAVVGIEGSSSSREGAVHSAIAESLDDFEKKIEAWQVVTSIFAKHPLAAKIGTKEGLKNSDRYRAFKVIEGADGNLEYKPIGFVRATKVAKNDTIATGESLCSNFYQISGRTLREGQYLKQCKDSKFSVGASYLFGDFNIAQVDFELLLHTSQTMGMMKYTLISAGYQRDDDTYTEGVNYFNVSCGFGIGVHPVRMLEIMPYIGVGADYCKIDSDLGNDDDDDDSFTKKLAYYALGGVKVGLNMGPKLQLFARGQYVKDFSSGDYYFASSKDRFGKVEFGLGLKINL